MFSLLVGKTELLSQNSSWWFDSKAVLIRCLSAINFIASRLIYWIRLIITKPHYNVVIDKFFQTSLLYLLSGAWPGHQTKNRLFLSALQKHNSARIHCFPGSSSNELVAFLEPKKYHEWLSVFYFRHSLDEQRKRFIRRRYFERLKTLTMILRRLMRPFHLSNWLTLSLSLNRESVWGWPYRWTATPYKRCADLADSTKCPIFWKFGWVLILLELNTIGTQTRKLTKRHRLLFQRSVAHFVCVHVRQTAFFAFADYSARLRNCSNVCILNLSDCPMSKQI